MISQWTVFCFLLISLMVFVRDASALNKGDKGVCVVKISAIELRKVSYSVIDSCRGTRRRCRVRKWKFDTFLKWRNTTICCQGWQHDEHFDTCKPICSTGCLNGTCVAPDTCHCDPPLYLDPDHKNVCLAPICDRPCVNSVCVKNNTCECVSNTRRYNETHCASCDENYSINEDLSCTPKCTTPCVNGVCAAPDKCRCLVGYTPVNDFTCKPQCDKCVNSECVSPNKCACLPGYNAVNDTHCVPSCGDCEGGECLIPGLCFCPEFHRLVEGGCEPVCSKPCVNGECSAPDECTCYGDHARSATNTNVCCRPECGIFCDSFGECPWIPCVPRKRVAIPNCKLKPSRRCFKSQVLNRTSCCPRWKHVEHLDKCEPICKFGCVNGTCVKPDVCRCEPPLLLQNHVCVPPVCEQPCHKARCVGTNTCECNDNHHALNNTHCIPTCKPGYINDPYDCRPVCHEPCINGLCTAPDTCICLPGYIEDETNVCVPRCESPCNNGFCSKPNECTCEYGYRLDPSDKFNCRPICEPECVNAFCDSPNMCSCKPGYEVENTRKCKPICHSCENGECIAPGNCSCNDGYTMKDGRCAPVCDKPCLNGNCSMPNVCSCYNGFKRNAFDNFTCDPSCEPECVNSKCVSPNTCSCDSGYEVENNWKCKPVCESCENGKCISPGNCTCNEGYAMKDGRCAPVCDKPCLNGNCSMPNVCSCHVGFELNAFDNFTCHPICDPECVNSKCIALNTCLCLDGYGETNNSFVCKPTCESCEHGACVAPNMCRCNKGFNMTDGKCFPICTKPCENAYCTSPNTCTCFDGFVREEGHENICYQPCDPPCETNAKCNGYGVCVCNSGFEKKINDTCSPIELAECGTCEGNCLAEDGGCWCANGNLCYMAPALPEEVASSTSLAGLEWSWMLGGAVGLLLIVLLLVVMQRTWVRRKADFNKTPDNTVAGYGSVMYHTVVPNSLVASKPEDGEAQEAYYEEVARDPQTEVQNSLMETNVEVEDDRL